MDVFDGKIGNWIQIVDDKSLVTIENYGIDTGVVEGTTGNHCVKCVSANHCWFKNEQGKKPEKFDFSGNDKLKAIIEGMPAGLYHFNCHCKEIPIFVNSIEDIKLYIPDGKFQYVFSSKGDWIKAMGYSEIYDENFVQTLLKKTRESYFYGNYSIVNHTKYGCKINLYVNIPGANEKIGKVYKLKTSHIVYPNGKLRMVTPIGGWVK